MNLTADEIISRLQLTPHPEGGHYRETFRGAPLADGRAASTAILFLLGAGDRSHWHRIDAVEIWHFYAGAALLLEIADGKRSSTVLGPAIDDGQTPQAVVPTGAWQAARTLGEWTLVGCTVAPGFRFEGFELAPPGFEP